MFFYNKLKSSNNY